MGMKKESWEAIWGIPLIVPLLAPLVLLIDGVATFWKQAKGWLKTGIWEPRDFWTGVSRWVPFERPSFGWVIPDKLLNWMLDGSRAGWMIVWAVALWIMILILYGWLGKLGELSLKRWQARHERPFLTKRGKISLSVFAVWLLGFPTAVSLQRGDFKDWGVMCMAAAVLALYISWPVNVWLDRKEKGRDKAHP